MAPSQPASARPARRADAERSEAAILDAVLGALAEDPEVSMAVVRTVTGAVVGGPC